MPAGLRTNIECKNEFYLTEFKPQKHQEEVVELLKNTPYKGLMLYHKLGSGKTCTSILASDSMLKTTKKSKVFVLTPGSLRKNFIDEYCRICGTSIDILKEKYTFITYNTELVDTKTINKFMFDKSVVIIDEAHNLINGVKNGSKNAVAIYSKLLRANCKILALTATPIYTNPSELSLYIHMFKPDKLKNVFNPLSDKKDIFRPTSFTNLFKKDDNGFLLPDPINSDAKNIVKNLFSGIVSHVDNMSASIDYYPKRVDHKPIKIEMSKNQEKEVSNKMNMENKLKNIKDENEEDNEQLRILASKRIMSKRKSNFYYPPELQEQKDNLAPKGWVSKDHFNNGNLLRTVYSPKIYTIIDNIHKNFDGKHMIFSIFKEKSGVKIIDALLRMCGVPSKIYSGDQSQKEKSMILDKFNSKENINGDIIKVIIITNAGSEGITLKEVQHVHIVESDSRETKIDQVVGRAIRYMSHMSLPPSKRIVNVWRYFSTFSDGEKSVDEYMYEIGKKQKEIVSLFLEMVVKQAK